MALRKLIGWNRVRVFIRRKAASLIYRRHLAAEGNSHIKKLYLVCGEETPEILKRNKDRIWRSAI
ncbi:MAG: hypothetical protein J7L19_02480 [Dehalococcoidia bacterium]|nr:hypothetical protein [Dehalococcoidia bacterium]